MMCCMRARRSTPATPRAARSVDEPMPGMKASSSRPPVNRSRWASSLPSSRGLRPGTTTLVPSFNRVVRAEAMASAINGSTAEVNGVSDSHNVSKRRFSKPSTNSANPSASAGVFELATAMRIFTDPTLPAESTPTRTVPAELVSTCGVASHWVRSNPELPRT